jgi:hypothetical protein
MKGGKMAVVIHDEYATCTDPRCILCNPDIEIPYEIVEEL